VLLLDNSAWSRIVAGTVADERAQAVTEWIEEDRLVTCLPFLLEVGFSARSAAHHKEIMDDLSSLPRVQITLETEDCAARAQRELAAIGHHRLPPIDVMIAACAHESGAGVLHYDGDYDIIAQRTSLQFESVWLAPRGSL
jgi:predicted nucleic acid-binding protein